MNRTSAALAIALAGAWIASAPALAQELFEEEDTIYGTEFHDNEGLYENEVGVFDDEGLFGEEEVAGTDYGYDYDYGTYYDEDFGDDDGWFDWF